jgi:hypothetical protein
MFFLAASLAAAPAWAEENEAQLWLNQQGSIALDHNDDLLFELNERARGDSHGGDQYQARLGLDHAIGGGVKIGGAVTYQRSGTQDEFRTHQQLTWSRGAFTSRSRLEQRFIEGDDRMALRLRQRLQLTTPMGGGWSALGYVEGSFTLRAGKPGGDTGLTSLRTLLGVRRDLAHNIVGTLAYVRQQDVRTGAPDRVGHAPYIGLSFSF